MDSYIAEIICKRKMRENGLDAWNFKWSNAKRTLGSCNRGTKTIALSRFFVAGNDEAKVINIIMHEIAHALTPGHKHDEVWRRKALELGSDGKRCQDTDDLNFAPAPFYYVCNNCDSKNPRYKRPKPGKLIACRACCVKYNGGKFTIRFKMELWDADILNKPKVKIASAGVNWTAALVAQHDRLERKN